MNKCCLVGWIASDVEFRESGDVKYLRFRLAVRRTGPAKEGQPKYDYLPCVAFGKTAEFINQYFKKGDYISLTANFRTGKYTTADGETKYTYDFRIEEAGFCSPAANGNNVGESAKVAVASPAPADQIPFEIPF